MQQLFGELKDLFETYGGKVDAGLLQALLSNKALRQYFFEDIDGILVFDKARFLQCVREDAVLSWPGRDRQQETFSPGLLTNFVRYTANGAQPVGQIFPEDNFLIRGDNLQALRSLKARYTGAVRLIYIDPPITPAAILFSITTIFRHSAG